MSLQVEKLENNMAKLTIEVPANDLEKALQSAYMKQKNMLAQGEYERPGFPGNGASFQSAGDPFRDPGHSPDGAGSRYVPHRLLDRYGAGKHGWNVSFRDSDRGRRNCPWNFPRRSAAEGIFLRIP